MVSLPALRGGRAANTVSMSGASDGPGIKAYHGSPHDFDRFSLDKIGTGEGAQAYGHGLYFAESEGVARSYRDSLSGKSDYAMREAKRASKYDDTWTNTAKALISDGMSVDEAGKVLRKAYKGITDDQVAIALHEANPGRMYEVNIKANPDDFLDWDKPLNEQPQRVRDAMLRQLPPPGTNPVFDGDLLAAPTKNGYEYKANIGRFVQKAQGKAAEDLTSALREAGVPGVKYLDRSSRGAGDGSRNYVVFDESMIEILRKYGLLGPLGLGAGAAAVGTNDGT
jgi:hypothetical protein